jgi:hypothetical protein
MAYVLSWRRKKEGDKGENNNETHSLIKYLRENPGFRWKYYIPIEDKPINYLEIGVFKGDNIIDVSKSYCKHSDSKIYCVDPWLEYNDYPEYKGIIQKIYEVFLENMKKENLLKKIIIHKDFSHNILPTFEDNYFDIVFIDGNHETEFVYQDGVVVLPKVKSGGTIIFDDYDWTQTKKGINNFLEDYKSQLTNLRYNEFQLFVDKL